MSAWIDHGTPGEIAARKLLSNQLVIGVFQPRNPDVRVDRPWYSGRDSCWRATGNPPSCLGDRAVAAQVVGLCGPAPGCQAAVASHRQPAQLPWRPCCRGPGRRPLRPGTWLPGSRWQGTMAELGHRLVAARPASGARRVRYWYCAHRPVARHDGRARPPTGRGPAGVRCPARPLLVLRTPTASVGHPSKRTTGVRSRPGDFRASGTRCRTALPRRKRRPSIQADDRGSFPPRRFPGLWNQVPNRAAKAGRFGLCASSPGLTAPYRSDPATSTGHTRPPFRAWTVRALCQFAGPDGPVPVRSSDLNRAHPPAFPRSSVPVERGVCSYDLAIQERLGQRTAMPHVSAAILVGAG